MDAQANLLLNALADALGRRNAIDEEIADLIGRPPEKGHIGEFIAAQLFDIELEESASCKGIDGRFRNGLLAGRSVNIKFYGKLEGLLDINPLALPDKFLVLAGPRTAAASSRGCRRPIVIDSVHLFDATSLMKVLERRGVKIGTATSVARQYWEDAEIYPKVSNEQLILTERQRKQLALFLA